MKLVLSYLLTHLMYFLTFSLKTYLIILFWTQNTHKQYFIVLLPSIRYKSHLKKILSQLIPISIFLFFVIVWMSVLCQLPGTYDSCCYSECFYFCFCIETGEQNRERRNNLFVACDSRRIEKRNENEESCAELCMCVNSNEFPTAYEPILFCKQTENGQNEC